MDLKMDKDTVQVVFVTAMTALGVVAIYVDGETGNAIGMAILASMLGIASYLFGVKKAVGGETDEEEVQK
jgi:hypothetical protein